jgi:O-antigen/teichoic acid export membrane protein
MLKRNVLANLVASVWIAGLTLLITPVQIHLLGIEAYGLIGFIASLQVIVGVLDLGLSSTITREIAGDRSPGRQASAELLRTAVVIYWGLAAAIGIFVVLAAGGLARRWFNPDTIDLATLQHGLQVAAIYLALRWPVALYGGVLAGVQRMDILNVIKAGVMTLRLVGGIVVLLIWPDLTIFLLWFGVSAIVEVAAFAFAARHVTPGVSWRPAFSPAALRAIWGFSSQMAGLAMLSMALTQLDRLMISKMLPLEQLGYYSLAYTAATGISIVISSLSTALMPSFAAAHELGARETMLARYDNANEVMLYGTGLVLFLLVFFGRTFLEIWVSTAAAQGAWRPLAVLAGGFWLGAAVSNAYTIAVASRRPTGLLIISATTGVLYIPLMYSMILMWGIDGAAWAWLLLTLSYVVTIIPFVHRRILNVPILPWFTRLFIPFGLLGFATFGFGRCLISLWIPGAGVWTNLFIAALAALVYSAVGSLLLSVDFKRSLWASMRGMMRLHAS